MGQLTNVDIDLLEATMRSFIRKKERVLVCYPENGCMESVIIGQLVTQLGGIPVYWGADLKWKTLLRSGFSQRCGAVVGASEIVLGLSKLAKKGGTPLYFRNAVLTDGEVDTWILEAIGCGFDCRVSVCCLKRNDQSSLDDELLNLKHELRRWTSILDYRLEKMSPGLSLEMIVFPREKLPKLPSFGKLVIREWDPENDCPFYVPLLWKSPDFSYKNH